MRPDGRPVEVVPGPFARLRRWLLSRMKHDMWMAEHREDAVHVHPINDLMAHELDGEDCACGPLVELVARVDGGPDSWMVVHHALDGRE